MDTKRKDHWLSEPQAQPCVASEDQEHRPNMYSDGLNMSYTDVALVCYKCMNCIDWVGSPDRVKHIAPNDAN